MNSDLKEALEKLGMNPGQGSTLEQIDKILRKQQRTELFAMLEQADGKEIEKFLVTLEKSIPQIGKKKPAVLRFSLPAWRGYDEVFWRALGDYVILALHRVTDVDYDRMRGKIKVEYFAKMKGRIKSPENIREIIRGIAFFVDTEKLPTDFTRFRRMAERRGHIGEMSKEQAALVGAAIKLISSLKV
jgi:hypothetical protein